MKSIVIICLDRLLKGQSDTPDCTSSQVIFSMLCYSFLHKDKIFALPSAYGKVKIFPNSHKMKLTAEILYYVKIDVRD